MTLTLAKSRKVLRLEPRSHFLTTKLVGFLGSRTKAEIKASPYCVVTLKALFREEEPPDHRDAQNGESSKEYLVLCKMRSAIPTIRSHMTNLNSQIPLS
uniref:Uncharacterized protein n=1 Tax=Nelumbo nucifera TaxID=4432 RepID=A0A822XUY7_NELNU|nr:TPA_asm: hypothetical protein HUJ06_025255 [Nelumbo nucifera]